jgi:chemotaxis protein methyltransferase CheR
LPAEWVGQAFVEQEEGNYCLRDEAREPVTFLEQDIRSAAPAGPFHLVLCRNTVFTYFELDLQQECLARIGERLAPGGALVIGKHETLPGRSSGWTVWSRKLGVYRMGQTLLS